MDIHFYYKLAELHLIVVSKLVVSCRIWSSVLSSVEIVNFLKVAVSMFHM